ncbi:MAG: hypothetical protein IIB00_04990 [candidate division Zixibacteria bacterium]|nr:hypothetical protein [candidate division Zixibacteria bacterium]
MDTRANLPVRQTINKALIIGVIAGCYLAQTFVLATDVYSQDRSRIYGVIHTVYGDKLEGFIRWDKNEGSWDDILDGDKERRSVEKRNRRKKYKSRRIQIFGMTIYSDDEGYNWSRSAQSGIAFGNIQTLEPIGDDAVLLTLKSGETLELENGSTDIGDNIREIVIEDIEEGELELEWDDIELIEFSQAPDGRKSDFGKRIYGTVTSRRGDQFTGFICWDMDELFETDILDGDVRDRRRKIRFGRIKSIERRGHSGSLVTLRDGKTLRMEDSNDVDDGNRGILISDMDLGRVIIEWDEFDVIEFSDPPDEISYDSFDGGKRLKGTVTTKDGDKYTGEITWDADEEYTWEILDGEYRGVSYDVFFGNIASIEPSRRGAIVILRDGRELRLRDSNDVDDGNKGIFIKEDGSFLAEVDWEDLEKIVFE